jgi:short-subunit dehydrogenase
MSRPKPTPTTTAVVTAASSGIGADIGLPKFMYMPSRDVARIGIDALEKDRGVVIPGWPTRIAIRAGLCLPQRVLLSLLAREHGVKHNGR